MSEPRTEAGRALADLIAVGTIPSDGLAIARIEAEAVAEYKAALREKVDNEYRRDTMRPGWDSVDAEIGGVYQRVLAIIDGEEAGT